MTSRQSWCTGGPAKAIQASRRRVQFLCRLETVVLCYRRSLQTTARSKSDGGSCYVAFVSTTSRRAPWTELLNLLEDIDYILETWWTLPYRSCEPEFSYEASCPESYRQTTGCSQ